MLWVTRTRLFCSSELLSLDTNQTGKLFHKITKSSGSSFCSAKADQNTPVRRGRVPVGPREVKRTKLAAWLFPHCKAFKASGGKTTGSSWPGESGTRLPLKTATWHLALVFLPLIKQTWYNMLMSKLLEVQAGGLFNLSGGEGSQPPSFAPYWPERLPPADLNRTRRPEIKTMHSV